MPSYKFITCGAITLLWMRIERFTKSIEKLQEVSIFLSFKHVLFPLLVLNASSA